jgi:hypothetical protein
MITIVASAHHKARRRQVAEVVAGVLVAFDAILKE